MNRERIEKIITELDDISKKYCDDDFNLAVYIYIRYGLHHFNNYISNDELVEINKILRRSCTLFNEDINDEVAEILNDDEED